MAVDIVSNRTKGKAPVEKIRSQGILKRWRWGQSEHHADTGLLIEGEILVPKHDIVPEHIKTQMPLAGYLPR